MKADQQKDSIRNIFLMKNSFLGKNSPIISKMPFISFPIHMQIHVPNCVLSSLKIPGLLDCQFTNAQFQSSSSETGSSLLASLAMPLFNRILTASS